MPARVMVVEDERIVAFDLQQRLANLGYEVPAIAASGEEALRKIELTRPDLVLMDIRIDGNIDGIETASRLEETSSVPVVYLTAHSDNSTIERARATHPYGYLLKPFTEREMHATIQMAIERHRYGEALRRSEEQLRVALEAADMGIMDIDTESYKADLAGRSAHILGLGETKTRTSCAALLTCVDEADRDRVRGELRRSMDEAGHCEFEFRRNTRGGRPRWIRAEGRNYPSRGPGKRMIGVVQDVTERKAVEERIRELNAELEEAVRRQTAELQARLDELDTYGDAIARDLRAPLQAIVGGCEMLERDLSARLDAGSRGHLTRIHDAGKRLSEMTEALLELSRITRIEPQYAPVDLSAMAREILGELALREPQRVVAGVIAAGIVANADPDLIRIVLGNLLRNAWKFTAGHASARVEFDVTQTGPETVYFVRDDGAGFDMAQVGKLFIPFSRLHGAREFEGKGLGLATVHRIVRRHGGRIWAESAREQGATIRFTLSEAA